MDNNLLHRLIKVRENLETLRGFVNKNTLTVLDSRNKMSAHFGRMVETTSKTITLIPNTFKISDTNISLGLRTIRNSCTSLVQAINDREISLKEARKFSRGLSSRIEQIATLLASDIEDRKMVATDLEKSILNTENKNRLSVANMQKEADAIIAANKTNSVEAAAYKPKLIGNSFEALRDVNDLINQGKNVQSTLNMLQKAIDPERTAAPPVVETPKIPKPEPAIRYSGRMDESMVRLRATLAKYNTMLPRPGKVESEVKTNDYIILANVPVLIRTLPEFSKARLMESGMRGEILHILPDSMPNDAMANFSMGAINLGLILENQIVIGVSTKLSDEDRSEIVDNVIFSLQNRFGKLEAIELGESQKRLSDFTTRLMVVANIK